MALPARPWHGRDMIRRREKRPYLPRMNGVLAVRNIVHDKVRLAVMLVGIVFAVVLIGVQLGLFLGFAKTTSALVDYSGADLWIVPPGTRDVDQSSAISERKLYQTLAVPGIRDAAKLIVEFTLFKRPDGGQESVLVVGFDPQTGLGGPWNVVAGDTERLRFSGTIMVDERYQEKLGIDHLGQIVEISDRRAQVVGLTRNIRSFTQSPYVFTSFQTALDYARIRHDQTKYVLARLEPGADINVVKASLAEHLADVVVLTTEEFSNRTQFYWMFTTGAGLALLIAAIMGLIVGIVVVSQTLYATTVDHLAEFGTLRAIGASSRYIYGVITRQAILSAIAGYVFGLLVSLAIARAAQDAGPAILLPPELAAGMLALTVAMCVGAALISIKKVTRLDPSMVFK
jgi:putative ABC transport system permease protein